MKISELLQRPVEYIEEKDIDIKDAHLPELDVGIYEIVWPKNTRISQHFYKHFNFDSRRIWSLSSIFFDNKLVMILQTAGREGRDYCKRFITDDEQFYNLINYINSELIIIENVENTYNIDDEIEDLDNFYGSSLDGAFVKHY